MSDVTIEGTGDTVHFPAGMKPEEIAKVMSSHPVVKKIRAKVQGQANIAASLKSQGITESDVRKKGTTAAIAQSGEQHENAASRARAEAALKATHDAQVYRLHGGGMGYNKGEQAKERAAADASSKKFQGLRTDPGTLLNQLQPHFDATLAQQQGKKGAVYDKAAGLLNSIPDLAALAATEGAAEIPEIAGQSLVTRGFQAQQVAGLAHEAADQKLRKEDPGKYFTSLLLGGLLAGAPDITSHAVKGLSKATEKPVPPKPAEVKPEPAKSEPVKASVDKPRPKPRKIAPTQPKAEPPTPTAKPMSARIRPTARKGTAPPAKSAEKPADVPQVKPKVESKPVEHPTDTTPGGKLLKETQEEFNARTNPSKPTITPDHVKAHAKDGFTKAADLYAEAKKTEPNLTKEEFAQRLYEFHKGDTHNYEGPSGNAKPADIFTAADASGNPIRYYGFSEKTSAKQETPAQAAVVKPTYPKPATQKPTAFVQTKVANAYTEQARAMLGLEKLPPAVRIDRKGIADHVIKNGMHYDAVNVAKRVLEGGHAMSTEEVMANNLRQNMIESRIKDLHKVIDEKAKTGEDSDAQKIEIEELTNEDRTLTNATKRTGTLTSQALGIRTETVDEYSHPGIRRRLEEAIGPDKQIKPEVQQAATKIVKERDALVEKEAARAKVKADKSELDSKHAGAEAVAKMKARTVVRADKKAELDAELKTHIARLVKVTSQLNAGVDPAIIPIVRDIAVNRLKVASLSAEALVDQVHAIVSEHLPDISKRDVRDAISGYGQDPQSAKRSQLAEIKTQLKLISEIEDARAGVAREQRIAGARQKASATVQALRKERDEVQGKPAAVALRMQEMRMKGLQKRLAEVTKKADAGDTSVKPRTPGNASPQELALRKQIAEKQKVINDLRAKEKAASRPPKQPAQPKPKTPAQTRLERLEKQFEDIKAKNAEGDYGAPARPPRPDTPDEAGMRHKLNAAQRERGAMRKAKSTTPPKDTMPAYKKAQQKRMAELQRQIDAATKDTPKPKRILDPEAEANKLEIKRKEKELDRLVKSQQPKSFQDRLIAFRRFAALSRVGSLTKLGAAAGERMVFGPLEEVTGLPARYLTPSIERAAPTQGRPSIAAEKGALNKYFSKQSWTKEAVDKFRTGANSIDVLHGGKEAFEGEDDKPTLLNLPGRLHGAIKTPAQLAAFERAQIKGTEWAQRQGLDINDPLVQGGVDARAYQESLRAILMQDNTATDLYKSAVTSMEKSSHPAGKATATAMRAFMPIVKVPTNFAGEVGLHMGGAVGAAWEVKVAGGVKNLTPEQADIVLRSLKKNGVGGMMFAIGYFNPQQFGGEYVQGRKRKPGDPEYNAIRVGSIELPHNLLHNPALEALQIGATWRKVQDDEIAKRASGHPFLRPAEYSVLAVGENLPFLDFPQRYGRATEQGGAGMEKFAGEEAASMAIPGFMSEAGALFNKDAQGKQIKHKPQGFWDEIKMAAGFQSTVPTSSPSTRTPSIPKMNADGSIPAPRAPRGMALPKY